MDRSTFSIIGDRYLDTQHDDDYIQSLEAELKRRGVTGPYRWLLEYVAASSLWWNILWWDWSDLNEEDIKIGWQQNLVVFGVAALVGRVLCRGGDFLGPPFRNHRNRIQVACRHSKEQARAMSLGGMGYLGLRIWFSIILRPMHDWRQHRA